MMNSPDLQSPLAQAANSNDLDECQLLAASASPTASAMSLRADQM